MPEEKPSAERYFITAIGTDSGKTVVSAILCGALKGTYWKPIQAGLPRDYDTVAKLVGDVFRGHPETYLLKKPIAPHIAAREEGVALRKENLLPPKTNNPLIIEGAGGCMVPLNEREYMIDLAEHFQAKVILVANLYLGAINHTLLSCRVLPKHLLCGLVINGPHDPAVEETLLTRAGLPLLLRLYPEKTLDCHTIARYGRELKHSIRP